MINNIIAKKRGKEISKMNLTKIRYLPKDITTPSVINIYNEKVTFYSVTENKIPFIILIENKELSKSFKEYFEYLWGLSKNNKA